LQLLTAIKGLFVGYSSNIFLHPVWWQLLFWLEISRITQEWLWCLMEVLESWRLGFLLLYPSCHLGSPSLICSWIVFVIAVCFNSSKMQWTVQPQEDAVYYQDPHIKNKKQKPKEITILTDVQVTR
jgi:hypothetical protein